MKKILITGANSYIGTSFENYIHKNYPKQYVIDTVDMVNPDWKLYDFSTYDSVFHVAGIAHSDSGKISKEKEEMYYAINTHLAIETTKKAKNDGAKQFVFMSSIIVYGDSAPVGHQKMITASTQANPANCYGDSKLQAEKGIRALESDDFKVVVIRPPMVYGKGCKGNYPLLVKIAKLFPIFPYVNNQRSMLHIDNLCEFIRLMVENEEQGTFFPQNKEYSNTSELVKQIGAVYNKKIILIKGFEWCFKILGKIVPLVNKAFGNLTYSFELSEYKDDYRVLSHIEETIKKTEC